ncbi:MAG: Holliday junction resolvase RuvX [Eubacterium sp.]|nr:Holliday junction resolvase RuvX [Eubacterium sp.]
MRYMGLDYGDKTVGVAVSDEMGITAQPYITITRERRNKLRQTCKQIEDIIREKNIEVIVVGKPLNMNGTEGERIEETREFIEMVRRRTGLTVEELDERLTTVEADRILDATGVAKENRKEYIDKMAAAIILQTYLDMKKNG